MPKEGLPDTEWFKRLRLYASGQYSFGRGQAPPPNSKWAKKRALIDACPVRKAHTNIFGEKTTSNCGFHPEHVSPSIEWITNININISKKIYTFYIT